MNENNAVFLTDLSLAAPSFFGPEFLYSDPQAILSASELSTGEKREILSSWASDSRAVPDAPGSRMLDNGQTVGIHDVLDALKMLDAAGVETGRSNLKEFRPRPRSPSPQWVATILRRHRRNDDDDDPPPCPAVIAPLPRFPIFGAESVLAAA